MGVAVGYYQDEFVLVFDEFNEIDNCVFKMKYY